MSLKNYVREDIAFRKAEKREAEEAARTRKPFTMADVPPECLSGILGYITKVRKKVEERRTPEEADIPHWWWLLYSNDFDWPGDRLMIAADGIWIHAVSEIEQCVGYGVSVEHVVGQWLESTLGGPIYPPGGVEEFLSEWSGAKLQDAA